MIPVHVRISKCVHSYKCDSIGANLAQQILDLKPKWFREWAYRLNELWALYKLLLVEGTIQVPEHGSSAFAPNWDGRQLRSHPPATRIRARQKGREDETRQEARSSSECVRTMKKKKIKIKDKNEISSWLLLTFGICLRASANVCKITKRQWARAAWEVMWGQFK